MTPAARTFKGSFLFCPRGQIPRARRGQTHAPFPYASNLVKNCRYCKLANSPVGQCLPLLRMITRSSVTDSKTEIFFKKKFFFEKNFRQIRLICIIRQKKYFIVNQINNFNCNKSVTILTDFNFKILVSVFLSVFLHCQRFVTRT